MVSETATSGAAGTHVKQKELRDMVRQMARNAESLLATALSAHVVKKSARLSVAPRGEVEKVLAEILISGQQAPNPEGVLQTIDQMMAQVVRPK
jgi:hypothetical protein